MITIKSAREIETMAQAGRIVGETLRLMREMVRPGLTTEDLDAAASRIGPARIGPVSDAVQPGRRIATVRTELGLGVPVALMTP